MNTQAAAGHRAHLIIVAESAPEACGIIVSLWFNIRPWTLPSACAVCDSAEKVVPIAYGLILDSGRNDDGSYRFWWSGCEVGFLNPDRHCYGCGNEWHTLRAFGPLLILIFLVCCVTVFTG